MKNCQYVLNILLIVAFLFGDMTSCTSYSNEEFLPAYWPTQDWRNTLPEEQGMDSAKLVRMFEYIEDNNIDLHSLLIVRNGFLVMEAYWHPYGPNDRHSIESITKTVVGTLLGIAIDRGEVKNVKQKLVDFFPERIIQNMDKKNRSPLVICFR